MDSTVYRNISTLEIWQLGYAVNTRCPVYEQTVGCVSVFASHVGGCSEFMSLIPVVLLESVICNLLMLTLMFCPWGDCSLTRLSKYYYSCYDRTAPTRNICKWFHLNEKYWFLCQCFFLDKIIFPRWEAYCCLSFSGTVTCSFFLFAIGSGSIVSIALTPQWIITL